MSLKAEPNSDDIQLVTPYGGKLADLMVSDEERHDLARHAGELASMQMTSRMLCDIELLATGGFSPLTRFMGKADYERVVEEMRLADGTLFPVPVNLSVPAVDGFREGQEIALRNA